MVTRNYFQFLTLIKNLLNFWIEFKLFIIARTFVRIYHC